MCCVKILVHKDDQSCSTPGSPTRTMQDDADIWQNTCRWSCQWVCLRSVSFGWSCARDKTCEVRPISGSLRVMSKQQRIAQDSCTSRQTLTSRDWWSSTRQREKKVYSLIFAHSSPPPVEPPTHGFPNRPIWWLGKLHGQERNAHKFPLRTGTHSGLVTLETHVPGSVTQGSST